jgi:DNA-binding SARP family transcriptional activator
LVVDRLKTAQFRRQARGCGSIRTRGPTTKGGVTVIQASIVLHGPRPELRAAAGGPAQALQGRLAALLALVALEPGIARDRAAALLWPDSDRGRQNLRQLLLRLRALTPLSPLVDGDAHLALSEGVVLAAAETGAELLAGESAEPGDGEASFAAWLHGQRASERSASVARLRSALAAAEAAGALDEALAHAQAWAALEPLDEAAPQALMRLHYLRGEAAAGLRVYEGWRERLDAELGVEPAAATREQAALLRRARAGVPGAVARPQAPLQATLLQRPPRLVGRTALLEAVHAAWAAGQVPWIEGEAGMGKSRLLAELAPPGPGVWLLGGRPGDRGVPYATLARSLAARGAPALAEAPADAARLLPAVQRQRRLVTLRDWIADSAIDTLVVDDLQFADDATLDLLAALATAQPPGPRWLLALRPAEAHAGARALRMAWAEAGRLVVLALPALDESATGELLDDLALAELDTALLAPALRRHTGGNPLFLLESIKQGLADGSLTRGVLPHPGSVKSLIALRLEALSEPALMLARVAAVAGLDFGIELAETVTGQRAAALAGAWAELQRAQVLHDEAFAHDLVAEVCRAGVPTVVARRLHAQCAEWLGAHGGEPARLALHLERAGRPADAAEAWLAAEVRAAAAGRARERGEHLLAAARCLDAAGSAAQRDRAFELRLQRAATISYAEGGGDMVADVQALHDQATSERQRVQAACVLTAVLSHHGQLERAVEVGLAALQAARRIGAHAEQMRLASPLQHGLTQLGRAAELADVLLPMRPWVEAHGTPEQQADVLAALGAWLSHQDRVREGIAAREQALAVARRHGLPAKEGDVLSSLSVGYSMLDRPDNALELSRQAVAHSEVEQVGASRNAVFRYTLSRHLLDVGRYGEALAQLEAIRPLLHDGKVTFWSEAADVLLARLWIEIAQPARAVPLLRERAHDTHPMLRGHWLLRCMELGAMPGFPEPAALRAEAASMYSPAFTGWIPVQVALLNHREPEEVLAEAPALLARAAAMERFGLELSGCASLAAAAVSVGEPERGRAAWQRGQALLAEGIWPATHTRAGARVRRGPGAG